MRGRSAASRVGGIHDVVLQQPEQVQQLERRSDTNDSVGGRGVVVGVGALARREVPEADEPGPHEFAAGCEKITHERLERRCLDQR